MIISFFYEKIPKITILFWVLVIGFLNLVSVDAKERSIEQNLDLYELSHLKNDLQKKI